MTCHASPCGTLRAQPPRSVSLCATGSSISLPIHHASGPYPSPRSKETDRTCPFRRPYRRTRRRPYRRPSRCPCRRRHRSLSHRRMCRRPPRTAQNLLTRLTSVDLTPHAPTCSHHAVPPQCAARPSRHGCNSMQAPCVGIGIGNIPAHGSAPGSRSHRDRDRYHTGAHVALPRSPKGVLLCATMRSCYPFTMRSLPVTPPALRSNAEVQR